MSKLDDSVSLRLEGQVLHQLQHQVAGYLDGYLAYVDAHQRPMARIIDLTEHIKVSAAIAPERTVNVFDPLTEHRALRVGI